jgi:hypothetical protein
MVAGHTHNFPLVITLQELRNSERIPLKLFMIQTDGVRLYFSAVEGTVISQRIL